MNLPLRTPALPAMLADWFNPDKFFARDLFGPESDYFVPRLGVTVPAVNIQETNKDYVFEMAVPGFERKDFNIELDNRLLTIGAEKDEKEDEKKNGYLRREYSYSSFERSFTLPDDAQESNIDAKYENGVLRVTIPKVKETISQEPKKIVVG